MSRIAAGNMLRIRGRLAWACVALTPSLSLAGDLPKEFSLGRYVPSDVWFYVHRANNPERAWIDAAWADVFRGVQESGIVGDAASVLLASMEADQQTSARANIEKATTLISAVDWSALTEREWVFAERMAECCVGYEYLFLARGSEGSGEANFKALGAIQEEIATLAGTSVGRSTAEGVPVRSVRFEMGDLKRLGFSIELFRQGDLIGVVTGRKALTDVVALLTGKGQVASLAASKRFTEAIDNVPPPRDSISFFDAQRFVGDFATMFDKIHQFKGKGRGPGRAKEEGVASGREQQPSGHRPAGLIGKILHEVNIVDYNLTTMQTEGLREWSRSYTRLREGAQDRRLAKAIFRRRPFETFDRFVPVNAAGFSLSPAVDFEQLYKTIRAILTEIEPDAATKIAALEARLARTGFDPQRDLFDWLGGEMIHVELPAAMATPMKSTDSVYLVRVKDAELASTKVHRGIDKMAELMQAEGQMLMIAPAPVKAKGFRQVTHPLLAMLFQPVIGVHEEWLVLGTSADAINACLAVASGEAPSIAANERFQSEGLTPKGAVRSLSFKDTSKRGQQMATIFTMAGTFGSMAIAGMPETGPEDRKAKQFLQKLLELAAKAGPILQRVNFYSSEAHISVYDGARTVRSECLVTYKRPSPPTPPVSLSTPALTGKNRKPSN